MNKRQWTHYFKVQGHGRFPYDMLRYDRCYPAYEDESYKLDTTDMPIAKYLEDRVVELVHVGSPDWRPMKARWTSFGWHVVETRKA